jgi:N12 class adenine-specific DNA methylase
MQLHGLRKTFTLVISTLDNTTWECRYIDELTGNKGIIFATGTPVSNSMTELYTLQRYLQYDILQAK